jgi:hypothetical protein
MTVKELIEELQQLPQDKQVVLRHRDHTDYTYYVDLVATDIDEEEFYDEYYEGKDKDEYGGKERDVVMIRCEFW